MSSFPPLWLDNLFIGCYGPLRTVRFSEGRGIIRLVRASASTKMDPTYDPSLCAVVSRPESVIRTYPFDQLDLFVVTKESLTMQGAADLETM